MDQDLPSGDSRDGSTVGLRCGWLALVRSKLLAYTIIAFAISLGFHEVERHVDKQLAHHDKIICQDIRNINDSRIHIMKVKLHCDK